MLHAVGRGEICEVGSLQEVRDRERNTVSRQYERVDFGYKKLKENFSVVDFGMYWEILVTSMELSINFTLFTDALLRVNSFHRFLNSTQVGQLIFKLPG
jgi:hypothetical protein